MEKLIISAAITGAAVMPSLTPYLPIKPKEVADEAIRAAEAGAASVHIHARNAQDGKPTADLEVYREIISDIKQRSNVIICITTGGSLTATPEQRISVVPTFKPELASFNCGSLSAVGFRLAAERMKDFKYEWEKPFMMYLNNSIFANTCADMEYFAQTMKESGTKPEHECYEVGHIYNVAYLVKEGFCQPPIWLQFVMGTSGGIQASPEDLLHMKHTADRVLGTEKYKWSAIGVGYPGVFNMAALSMMMGGHVRVGLEDNIFIERGVLAKSNAHLVEKAIRLARELGREPATPDEARQLLGLKGIGKVNF